MAKAFACGGVLYALIVAMIVSSGAEDVVYRCTYTLMTCLLATLAAGIWCHNDKQKWPWWRIGATVLGFYVALVFLQMQGRNR